METYPQVHQSDKSLSVVFAQSTTYSVGRHIEIILDFCQYGRVLGVEILNLNFKAGKNSLGMISHSVQTEGDGLRYAYDDDSDSFYLQLEKGRSIDQKALHGNLFLDDLGQIICLKAEWQ